MTTFVDTAPSGASSPGADGPETSEPESGSAGSTRGDHAVSTTSLSEAMSWAMRPVGIASILAGALILAALNVLAGPSGFWSADETVTHEQVDLLDEGIWTIPSPEPELDPEGRFYALQGVSMGANGVIAPYAKHPLFPILVGVGDDLGGRTGRFGVPAVASLLASVAIAIGAERRRRGSATPTFWFMLAGSPLLFHGAVLWAHSLGVLGAALAVLGLQHVLDGEAPSRRAAFIAATVAVLSVVGSVLLRSEAAVFFVVAGAVVVAAGLVRRRIDVFVAGVLAGLAAVATFVLEARWRTAILGDASDTNLGVPEAGMFDVEVRSTLLTVWATGLDSGLGVLRLLGIVMLITAAVRLRSGDSSALTRSLPLVAAACYCIAVFTPATSGVAIAAPLIALGIVFARDLDDLDRIALTTAGLAFVAVLLTSHANGGGGDWGGRYHAMSLAPLGIIAGPRIRAAWDDARRPAVLGGAIASAALAVGMFTNVIDKRAIATDAAVELEEQIAELGDRDDLVLITDGRIARLLGERDSEQRMLQVPPESMPGITDQLPGQEVILADWLTPYEVPADWTVVAETDEVVRYRLPG